MNIEQTLKEGRLVNSISYAIPLIITLAVWVYSGRFDSAIVILTVLLIFLKPFIYFVGIRYYVPGVINGHVYDFEYFGSTSSTVETHYCLHEEDGSKEVYGLNKLMEKYVSARFIVKQAAGAIGALVILIGAILIIAHVV